MKVGKLIRSVGRITKRDAKRAEGVLRRLARVSGNPLPASLPEGVVREARELSRIHRERGFLTGSQWRRANALASRIGADPGRGCSVYVMQDADSRIKVGISVDPEKRLKTIQTGQGRKVSLIREYPYPDERSAFAVESSLHRRLSRFRMMGEWFSPEALSRLDSIMETESRERRNREILRERGGDP